MAVPVDEFCARPAPFLAVTELLPRSVHGGTMRRINDSNFERLRTDARYIFDFQRDTRFHLQNYFERTM